MAITPSPERSDLESKSRDDLLVIAKVKGVDVGARATKTTLIDAIMGDAMSSSRTVRSRRTVATPPVEDFEDLIGEFAPSVPTPPRAEPPAPVAPSGAAPALLAAPTRAPSATPSPDAAPLRERAAAPADAGATVTTSESATRAPRGERTREFAEGGSRSRRNRRSRGNRERFPSEAMPGADQPYQGELLDVEGILDLRDDGYGFVRTRGFHASPQDVYVSINQVRRYGLRKGDVVTGGFRPASSNEKYPALLRVDTVAGMDPEAAATRPRFEDLTPLFPDEKLRLENSDPKGDLTTRIIDLIAPIGKGQRGLIVSPPKAGKTTVMKQIAHAIEANNPEVHLMVLLVDERPEEVTDMRRSVRGEVISSTFDRPADEHTHVAELAIERAKRLVEQRRDVVIILDGITRLARAYNLAAPATGRIMSGGVDSGALYPPKKFFGAARNIEEGGSLTILATALVETGSKMDEVIFEEFKGTGNMELKLDRRLAERRLYPAIDVNGSSTRREELLFDRDALAQVWKLRRVLNGLASEGREAAGLELLIDKLKSTRSNDEFLAEIGRGPTPNN
ncbi:MAG: transcription termination factor Rho [Acidimicrobiales bacterium]